ncbi:MAG: transglycosylase family protein [Acidimicrobiia bacterium]
MLAAVAVAACTFGAFAPAAAETTPAQASEPSVESLRADADAIAGQYFSTLTRAHELDDEIARTERQVDDLEAQAAKARAAARERALIAYRQAGSQLAVVVESDNVLDATRRARLIEQVNEHDNDVYAKLRKVSSDLQAQRRSLESGRAAQADALADLSQQGAAIDAKLAEAARKEAAQRATMAAAAAAAAPATSTDTTAAPAPAASPTTTPTTTPPVAVPAPPPDYSGTPGTHPHHDDPFLTCVRQRESGGNYSAVNRSGPYLGAYQFLQATWNATANHAHRTELVGVAANTATPYDQDDMAWTLYQWQGAGPWGGGCP